MRRATVGAVALALVVALAVTGCGRLGANRDSDAEVTPTTPASESTSTSLDDLASLLDDADGAVSQSESDLSEGDAAAAQE